MVVSTTTPVTHITDDDYQRVAALLAGARHVVLTTHRDPDGDGLGAEAALAAALAELDVSVRVINDGPVPPQYQFLVGSAAFETYDAATHDDAIARAGAVVLLDAARPERTGRLAQALTTYTGSTIAIDHHPTGGWAQVELIDPAACAMTELVHELLLRLPVQLTPAMAEALYTGLVADTQGFRTAHTTPAAHRRAAMLLEAGASLARVHEALFAAWPLGRQRLLGAFLGGLRTAARGRLVWGAIDQATLARFHQTPAATEGFVDEALAVAGADLAIFSLEEADAIRVSFRSRHGVRVDGLARDLGGGGHAQAAGTRLPGPLSTAVRHVLRAARVQLRDGDRIVTPHRRTSRRASGAQPAAKER
jgi:phosphoesterase RecJ-like protein